MNIEKIKKRFILGILFFLPVIFLLFLYPSTHNYNTLDIVKENVLEMPDNFNNSFNYQLKDHLTVLGFLGKTPMENTIMALNLKELIYDKFKGFKGFQVLILVPEGTQKQVKLVEKEIYKYEELKYWHFVYATENEIRKVYNRLESNKKLDVCLATNNVFIIDKDLNQRGRLDDRTDNEKAKKASAYKLTSYNCIQIAEIKNKMSEDLRILFTEYRQKRKGNFDSATRRANDIKPQDEKN
jgi:hypothetical protein